MWIPAGNNIRKQVYRCLLLLRAELQKVYLEKMELQNSMVQLQQEHNIKLQDLLAKHSALEMSYKSTVTQLNLSKSESENLKVILSFYVLSDLLKLTIQSQLQQIAA